MRVVDGIIRLALIPSDAMTISAPSVVWTLATMQGKEEADAISDRNSTGVISIKMESAF